MSFQTTSIGPRMIWRRHEQDKQARRQKDARAEAIKKYPDRGQENSVLQQQHPTGAGNQMIGQIPHVTYYRRIGRDRYALS